ncbi:MAG: hypothetical protein HGB35_01170 [Geobacteraceae bacterium]|nr:hypothetical protein [Geobacteraceae bacterium]
MGRAAGKSITCHCQAYIEKLSRKAVLSAEVTGAEGTFPADMAAERSFDKVTTSSGWMAVFLRRGGLPGLDVKDSFCRGVIVCCR